jgi:agmatinase
MALELDKMTRLPGDEAFRRESIKGTQWEATYAGALSFMRRKYTRDLTGVDIAVTGIPFDQAVSHRPGTRFGPEACARPRRKTPGARSGPGCSIPSIPSL